ncbi:hypothetical protein SAMN05192533_107154 [Mesobacillus persicus]|uniref:Uncharacterized protein n=1 Tax=Mesobacillus persicus TaxID=930146 RepID=A0A1H8CLZ1_9BACI|nr:hypothetical protein [Mesobacillus persicus]SEM96055.1 hypothetical protein SAMN05192533_107154 [Mesobacillus persicus]
MKTIGGAILATIILFFSSLFIVSPILSNLGYSSVDSSYHLQTHALIVTLIFTVILCTLIGVKYILEEIKKLQSKK